MLLALRIWLGERLFGTIGNPDMPAGYKLSRKRVLKWRCHAPELEGHMYVAQHTSIPVPRIHRTHMWRGYLGIEMEYLRGCETLQRAWWGMTAMQREGVVEQVSGYIAQLRGLRPVARDRTCVSSTEGGACRDVRVGTVRLFGLFDTVAGFHERIRGMVGMEAAAETFGAKVADIHARSYDVRFTHGDLGVQNILIRDGRVAAVIDWECAGWYPEYWEYTKMHYNMIYLPEFYEMLRGCVERRYDEELAAERVLWRVFNQPLDDGY